MMMKMSEEEEEEEEPFLWNFCFVSPRFLTPMMMEMKTKKSVFDDDDFEPTMLVLTTTTEYR